MAAPVGPPRSIEPPSISALISSPDNVSNSRSAWASASSWSRFSVRQVFARSKDSSTMRRISLSISCAVSFDIWRVRLTE
jgi:hypothetical protein